MPAKKRFEKKEKAVIKEVSSVEGNKYIYEINPAVIAAELSTELFPHAYLFASGKKKYLLSDVHIMSELLDAYAILGIADKDNVVDSLLRLKAGKVTLRGNLKQDEYFRLKNSIESKLSGKKKFELFFFDKIIISEKL